MKIKSVEFLQSVVDWKKCPELLLPEYAFIGRSNVGKSSLINMLANHSTLAKISSKPGKTQTINHFLVDKKWYLVDLPGYGYAKTSKSLREKWKKMILDYFMHRENLQLIFILIDARLTPQEKDIAFINSLGELSLPIALIFTKIDKISSSKLAINVDLFKNKLFETWEELPPYFLTSAHSKKGKEEVLNYIHSINELFWANNKKKVQ